MRWDLMRLVDYDVRETQLERVVPDVIRSVEET